MGIVQEEFRYINSNIFFDVTPYNLVEIDWCFGGTYRVHYQNRRTSQTRTETASLAVLSACFMLVSCLSYDREDGGDMLLGNVGLLSTVYTELYPRR
jgi:hypothetical protein